MIGSNVIEKKNKRKAIFLAFFGALAAFTASFMAGVFYLMSIGVLAISGGALSAIIVSHSLSKRGENRSAYVVFSGMFYMVMFTALIDLLMK